MLILCDRLPAFDFIFISDVCSMQVFENISLKPMNTFGIDVSAKELVIFSDADDLLIALERAAPALVLGGGSNILLSKNIDGTVFKNEIRGVDEISEDEEYVFVRAGAGESWHQFVLYTIERRWAGLENLSLIPGLVGASPMQNIGAYGVELKDVFHSLDAMHI